MKPSRVKNPPLPIPRFPPPTGGPFFASTDPRVKIVPEGGPKAKPTQPRVMTPAARAYWLAELRWQAHLRRTGRRPQTDVSYIDVVKAKRARRARRAPLGLDASPGQGPGGGPVVAGVAGGPGEGGDQPRYSPQELELIYAQGKAFKKKSGKILPIVDRPDLLQAIEDFKSGAIPEGEEADARAFIRMRARLMKAEYLLPVAWQLRPPAPIGNKGSSRRSSGSVNRRERAGRGRFTVRPHRARAKSAPSRGPSTGRHPGGGDAQEKAQIEEGIR